MERIARIVEVSEPRTFTRIGLNGKEEEVTVKEVEIRSGEDSFVVSAFDRMIEKMETLELRPQTVCNVTISCKCVRSTKEGKQNKFNRLTLEKICLL